MKILAVGDIVGKTGVQMLKYKLPKIMKDYDIDFVIVNGENAADGMGLTEKLYKEILSVGTDVVTMGNHTWAKKDIFSFIDDDKIVRPANYSNNNPGKGYRIYTCKNKKIAVINLIGRVTMSVLSENPFLEAKKIIEQIKKDVDIIVIDFQTADEQILDNGTAYITDIGMTGPKHSVIGMDAKASIKRFETSLPEKYRIAEGEGILNACVFEVDDETNEAVRIERIYIK